MSKHSLYVERLMRELPTHTKGGTPITILKGGQYVETNTSRSRNGMSSVYVPCDYPKLFGWPLVGGNQKQRPPLLINHKGRKYLRLSVQ